MTVTAEVGHGGHLQAQHQSRSRERPDAAQHLPRAARIDQGDSRFPGESTPGLRLQLQGLPQRQLLQTELGLGLPPANFRAVELAIGLSRADVGHAVAVDIANQLHAPFDVGNRQDDADDRERTPTG